MGTIRDEKLYNLLKGEEIIDILQNENTNTLVIVTSNSRIVISKEILEDLENNEPVAEVRIIVSKVSNADFYL